MNINNYNIDKYFKTARYRKVTMILKRYMHANMQ